MNILLLGIQYQICPYVKTKGGSNQKYVDDLVRI